MTAVLLAHQGGWDELLMVAAPIGVFALMLAVARRREGRAAGSRAGSVGPAAQPGHDGQQRDEAPGAGR